MTLPTFAPVITFAMVVVIGAALQPAPLPRNIAATPHASMVPKRAQTIRTARLFSAMVACRSRLRRSQPEVGPMAAATWCDDLARALRSGATLTAALRAATVPAGAETAVESVRLSLDRGEPLADALRPGASNSPHLDVVFTVLRACAQHGGTAAEPLDRAAATLRARAADQADRLTQSAQARLSAMVMTCLPVAMLALMLLTSGSVRGAVVSPPGLLAIGVGTTLNLSGWLWMRRTINRNVS